MGTFNIKSGDRLPSFQTVLVDPNGDPVDLTGGAVQFQMRRICSAALTVDAVATITDAVNGVVQYDWAAADTATAGVYRAEWVFTNGGLSETYPNEGFDTVQIEGDL